jgi:arylsulfatase A
MSRIFPLLFFALIAPARAPAEGLPNIVVILADDLGYGDVGCYNPESKVATPNLDRLAAEGMRFTDAHSPATVCTPSRYSLLTGRMAFRTGFRGVFTGVDGPLLEDDRLTLPQMLRERGYATACVGKWHVGMTFFKADGTPVAERGGGLEKVREVDFSKAIRNGPIDRGFDYFFGTVCCPTTDWLYAYIENDRVVEAPTELVKSDEEDWTGYGGFRTGLKAPGFEFRNVDLKFLDRSREYLRKHVGAHPEKPFFLFHNTQTAHLPALPAEEFVGKTETGPLGDFIFEFDHIVGALLNTLDELGVAENTLVIVTSDNGPEICITRMREGSGHNSARPWRGMKRDDWEGGHRVPFLARWPGKIAPGSVSPETICLTDIMATCASVSGTVLPSEVAEDSFDLLPVLRGTEGVTSARPFVLHQTMNLSLAIRRGKWKLLDHKGSGGNNYDEPRLKPYALPEKEPEALGQLYDLVADPGETTNLWFAHPGIVAELRSMLDTSRKSGRSAPTR